MIVIQDPVKINSTLTTKKKLEEEENIKLGKRSNREAPIKEDKDEIVHSQMGQRIMNKVSKSKVNTKFEFYNEKAKAKKKIHRNQISLKQLEEETQTVREFIEERLRRNDWVHEHLSEGQMACSVTSTGVDTQLADRKKSLSAMEMFKYIFYEVKKLQLETRVKFKTKNGPMIISKT